MSETITITQDNREVSRGLGKDSIITCTKTSAPDVYVAAVTPKDTTDLRAGDSTAEPRLTRVKFHLFRKNAGDGPFSAVIDITDAPPAPKAADHTLAVQFHVPQGSAPGPVKAAKRAGKKRR
jgi:hypothetical protein